MGFETIRVFEVESTHFILKQSLWDLKREQFPETTRDAIILKQSLWDLKRPIYVSTSSLDLILKQSLWDLKLRFSQEVGSLISF